MRVVRFWLPTGRPGPRSGGGTLPLPLRRDCLRLDNSWPLRAAEPLLWLLLSPLLLLLMLLLLITRNLWGIVGVRAAVDREEARPLIPRPLVPRGKPDRSLP